LCEWRHLAPAFSDRFDQTLDVCQILSKRRSDIALAGGTMTKQACLFGYRFSSGHLFWLWRIGIRASASAAIVVNVQTIHATIQTKRTEIGSRATENASSACVAFAVCFFISLDSSLPRSRGASDIMTL